MSNRPPYSAEERVRIGLLVLEARRNGEIWKALVTRFDRSREQLYRYAIAVQSGDLTVGYGTPAEAAQAAATG